MSEALDDLLRYQNGLLTVADGREHGLSREALAHRVDTGRWQRVYPGVFATFTGTLETEQRIWAGYLFAGEGAIVSHRSAWWLADRRASVPEVVEIVVPHRRVVKSRPGLAIKRSRRLDPEDIHPVWCPKRFTIERAVLDCAAEASSGDQAAALLASSVQRRTTTPDRLLGVLERLPNLARRTFLRDVLDLTGQGAHTLLEQAHARTCSSHGLPAPDRQRQIGPACVDAAYDMPQGSVIAEFDGKLGHFETSGWWKDMKRDNGHTVNRLGTLRFPGFVLLNDPHEVAATIAAALVARGWTGSLACPPGCRGAG